MKIGIDCRFWSESGVGRYIRNLVVELSKIDTGNKYYLLLLKKNLGQGLPSNFQEVEADVGWYGIDEQRKIPKILKNLELDLVHFPHFNVPIFYSGKYVVTIHDLIHKHHRMRRASTLNPIIYQLKHIAYSHAFKTSLKKSKKIITVSKFVKSQLISEMSVSDNKIEVTYEGVDENILNLIKDSTHSENTKTLDKFKIKHPFLFYVGNAHPHKNIERLIQAFLMVKEKEGKGKNLQLVLSGHDHYFWKRIKKNQESRIKNQEDIVFTGYITDEELVALYKSAECFVMPSLEEGFGIPLLEAMACGCPVISSNAASLPEIGGDAALYFDPKNLDDMAEKINMVLNDFKLKKALVGKGEKRYKQFSWKKLAEETLKIYESV